MALISVRTTRFKKQLEQLPENIQELAFKNFVLWRTDQCHPSLCFKLLKGADFWSIRIGDHYRAVGFWNHEKFIWIWIGSHAEYDHRF